MTPNLIALEIQQAWCSRTMQLSNVETLQVLELVRQELERDIESHRSWAAEEAEAGGGEEDEPHA